MLCNSEWTKSKLWPFCTFPLDWDWRCKAAVHFSVFLLDHCRNSTVCCGVKMLRSNALLSSEELWLTHNMAFRNVWVTDVAFCICCNLVFRSLVALALDIRYKSQRWMLSGSINLVIEQRYTSIDLLYMSLIDNLFFLIHGHGQLMTEERPHA